MALRRESTITISAVQARLRGWLERCHARIATGERSKLFVEFLVSLLVVPPETLHFLRSPVRDRATSERREESGHYSAAVARRYDVLDDHVDDAFVLWIARKAFGFPAHIDECSFPSRAAVLDLIATWLNRPENSDAGRRGPS